MKQVAKPWKARTSIVTGWDRNMEGIGGSCPVTSTGAEGRGGDMGTVWGPALGPIGVKAGWNVNGGSGEGWKPTGTFGLWPEGEGAQMGDKGEWGKGFVPDHDGSCPNKPSLSGDGTNALPHGSGTEHEERK